MTKQELLNGEEFFFHNDEWCIENDSDDLRQARITHDGEDSGMPSWAQGFKIQFNGTLLHSCKTFKSLENRLDKLEDKWNLKEGDEL